MKYFLILIALVSLVASSTAQTLPDSGKCPWHLPFSLSFSATYRESIVSGLYYPGTGQYDLIVEDTISEDSIRDAIVVDSGANYSFVRDTLKFGVGGSYYDGIQYGSGGKGLTIIFAEGRDSIISLVYSNDTSFVGLHWGLSNGYSLQLNGWNYDSSSIFYEDSSLTHAELSGSFFTSMDWPYGNHTDHNQSETQILGLVSVTLGGIIRPVTLHPLLTVSSPTESPKFELQVSPNPFSRLITIDMTTKEGHADVLILNLLGSEVAHLYSGELSVGEHRFTWKPNGAPPGMYECVVRMNGEVQTLPLMLQP